MADVKVVYGEATDTVTAHKFYRVYALPGYLVTNYGRIGTDGAVNIAPMPALTESGLHGEMRTVISKKVAQAKDNYVETRPGTGSEFTVDVDAFRRHFNANNKKAALGVLERAFRARQAAASAAGTSPDRYGNIPAGPRRQPVAPRPGAAQPRPAPPTGAGSSSVPSVSGAMEALIADCASLMTLTVTDPDKALVQLGVLRGKYQELQAQMRTVQGYLDTADDVLHLGRTS